MAAAGQMRGMHASRSLASRAAPVPLHGRHSGRVCCVRAMAVAGVDAEAAKRMIEKEGYKVVDIRSSREYDDSHITKPALSSVNVPLRTLGTDTTDPSFVSQVSYKFPSKAARMLLMCQDGGSASDEAVTLLQAAEYSGAVKLEGGYKGWTEVWTPSGKRRPPPGRWVSTGKEALKSGLNIPGVAESYDEGGNLVSARYADGLAPGQELPPMSR